MDYRPTALDDVVAALTKGEVNDNMPVWISNIVVLMGKLLGISVIGASAVRFLPERLVSFCKEVKIAPGTLIRDLSQAVEDFISRAKQAWELQAFAPFFEVRLKDEAFLEVQTILGCDPNALPIPLRPDAVGAAVPRLRLERITSA